MSVRPAERQGEVSRVSRSGRRITYCLQVIQQPERARACGAGAKCEQVEHVNDVVGADMMIASADRRPVDPPPVVQLRVFEGEGDKKEDITFSYEANFFLYASLEAARPIAHARHQPAPPQQPPLVLTGMPVSGMAYLDRPKEAGYFIFPDLSVRHEGRYRLSFNLYEQTKREHDLDSDPSAEGQGKVPYGIESPDSSFDFRMAVKSASFNVWSAKKFPGLKESTPLSRQVAEQGCRVRIRRDVRMRRRGDGKPGADYEESYEDPYARGRAQAAERESPSRSSSPSAMDAASASGRPYYHSQPANNHSFTRSSNSNQFTTPSSQFTIGHPNGQPHHSHAPLPPPAPHHYQQAAPPSPPPPSFARSQLPYQSSYQYNRQYPHSAYPANAPRESFEQEARRASAPHPTSVPREYPSETNTHRASFHHPYPFPRSSYNAPPAPTLLPPPPSPVVIAPIKLNEPKFDRQPSLPSIQGPIVPDPYAYGATEPIRAGGKRGFESAFRGSSIASGQPLYNGQRPSMSHIETLQDDDDDDAEDTMESLRKMSYKRADGYVASREIPSKI